MATKDDEPTPQKEQQQTATTAKKRKSELAEIQVDLSAPEPPSKKARRLLKKGKKLPKKQSESGDESEKPAEDEKADSAADDKKKKKERSPYGVWIGNLPFSVTKADLRKWLVGNSGGVITEDAIPRVHMPTNKLVAGSKKTPENKGFAYVDFGTYEANTAAIALSETELNGRRLLIKDANNYEGRPKKEEPEAAMAAKIPEGRSSTKIFVGNLAFNTTEDDLWAHFEKCGKIRWVKVATFEDSGKCKGYGWVMFEEPEAAQWAVKGFVKIRETVETVEDFMDRENKADGDGDTEMKDTKEDREEAGAKEKAEDGDDEADSKREKPKKKELKEPRTRVRKWWVNQLFGRNLKVELAEDDQTRYQKRFGKGAKKKQKQEGEKSAKSDTNAVSEEKGSKSKEPKEKDTKREPNFVADINVARLTGAVVAPQGKKVKFDE